MTWLQNQNQGQVFASHTNVGFLESPISHEVNPTDLLGDVADPS